MKLIYFHGFGSSSQSGTIRTLRELMPDFQIIAPDIPVDPAEALPFLKQLCKEEQPDVVVGTSMGGMYAQQMSGFRRICVNPALEMSSKSKVLKVGTFEYFKPRLDGETHFTITPEIIEHFAQMEMHQFDDVTNEQKEMVYGLFGSDDNQTDSSELFVRHYRNALPFEGGHRLSYSTICAYLIPLIREITGTETPQNRYALLKTEMRHKPERFSVFDKKEGMQIVVRKNTSNQFLVNRTDQTAIEIANIYNCVKCFTTKDVAGEESSEKECCYYTTGKDLRISDFENGIAKLKYIIREEGFHPFDEDGYGFEEWSEESLWGAIDKKGKIVRKLH